MGYTHYWRRPAEIPTEIMARIAEDFGKLVLPLSDAGVLLGDGFGDNAPEISADKLWFNGLSNCGHPQNSEITIPWPSENAGGLGESRHAEDGHWFAGVKLDTRCCNGDCSYETFAFLRMMERSTEPDEHGLYFDCCKTAFRPYDIAVTAALIIAKRHMGARIEVSSDGQDTHWFDAKMLCQAVLGYGLEYEMTGDGLHLSDGSPDPEPFDLPKRPEPARDTRPVRDVSLTDTAKAIRAALKAAYPAVKFSVRSKSYTGGCSITVSWIDGPTSKQVEPLLAQFKGADFDGMQDLKTYRDPIEVNGERVRYHADYVFTSREISYDRLFDVADRVCYELGAPMVELCKWDSDGSGHVSGESIAVPYSFHLPYDVTAGSLDENVQHIAHCEWNKSNLGQLINDVAYATAW